MPSVEEAWARLPKLADEIDQAKGALDSLYEERRELFRVLLDAGEKQAAVARAARVTPMAVAFALNPKGGKRASA